MSHHNSTSEAGPSTSQISNSPSPVATANPMPPDSLQPHRPTAAVDDREKRPQDYKVEKFLEASVLKANGSNYTTWKHRTSIVLRSHKWEDYALGLVPCPDRRTNLHGYSTWMHIDSLVVSQMASNIEDDLFGEISTDDMTSANLWQSIRDRFEEVSELAQTTIHAKLCGKRIREGETMKDHVLDLRRLKAEYCNRGGTLTKAQWHSIIVASLEEHSYWHQMDLYADVIEDPEQLIKKLELKEIRGKTGVPSQQSALQAQFQQQQTRGPRYAGPISRPSNAPACTNCRRGGHSIENCYAPGGGAAHRRLAWYKVPRHMLDKERAHLAAQLRAIDVQRAQYASQSGLRQSHDHFEMPSMSFAGGDADPKPRHEVLVAGSSPRKNTRTWILDSGATSHMTFHRTHFVEFSEIPPMPIYTARENETLYAVGEGTIKLIFLVNTEQVPVLLSHVLYVPELSANLLSLAKLDERGLEYGGKNGMIEFRRNGRILIRAAKIDEQWIVDSIAPKESVHIVSSQGDIKKLVGVWHQRLGHVNQNRIAELYKYKVVRGLDITEAAPVQCETCILSKMHATPSLSKELRARQPGDIVHADLEFMSGKSFSGVDTSLKFIDEYSNFLWAFPISNKEAATVVSIWSNLCSTFSTQFSIKVKALHTDNGTEFVNHLMDTYNKENGIEHHKIAPRRHEMNGRAERMNRTGANAVRSMLMAAGLPNAYWAEAYETFAYIHNRTASSAEPEKTPYETLYNKKPDISHICIFGCTAYMRIPPEERRKLDPKARKLILVGYRDDAAYRLFDPSLHKIYYSRDVIFDEFTTFAVIPDASQAKIEELPQDDDPPNQTLNNQELIRRSSRISKPTARRLEGLKQEMSLSHLDRPQIASIVRERRYIDGIPIPRDHNEAIQSSQAQEWIAAMLYEISKLEGMQCWQVEEKPSNGHVIDGLWVYNLKQEVDGSLEYRARWVARGDSQIDGIEFDDTFASAGDFVIARIVFARGTKPNSSLITLDVNSAYLHSPLDQDNLFVKYPSGFSVPGFDNPVCKLQKALYGLRQGARAWEQHLSQSLISLGFNKCISAPSAFYRSTNEGDDLLATHSDDIQANPTSLAGDTNQATQTLRNDLRSLFEFKEKDTRTAAKVLGMTVERDEERRKIKISVGMKIDGMLERYCMKDAKTADSPMLANALALFERDDSEGYDHPPWPYSKLIGELLWIGNTVRPDIAFAVNVLARQLKKPKTCHWEAAKRILRYLKGTRDLGITYNSSDDDSVIGYSDSDWGTDPTDRKSTGGFIFIYAGGAISWRARKQTVVATSTAEAEYLAVSATASEAKWLRSFFDEIGQPLAAPTNIFVDNMAAILMTQNPVYQSKTKHIDLCAHHIRDEVAKGTIHLSHVQGILNPADVLTKPLSPILHKKCVELLGMT